MLKPTTYKALLEDADAVVHSTGILLEADYKAVLSGKESLWSGLSRAFSATKLGSQNPLERKPEEPLEAQEKDGQFTYELMNRDTGIVQRLSRDGAAYVSADRCELQQSPLRKNPRLITSPLLFTYRLQLERPCCPIDT